MLLDDLRRELSQAARELSGSAPEPLLILSRDERLASPLALRLGLAPDLLASRLSVRVRLEGGFLNLEPSQELYRRDIRWLLSRPLVGMPARLELLLRMARKLGLYPCLRPPLERLTAPQESLLMRYAVWLLGGVGRPERLQHLLSRYYQEQSVLQEAARVALVRAVSTSLSTSAPAYARRWIARIAAPGRSSGFPGRDG